MPVGGARSEAGGKGALTLGAAWTATRLSLVHEELCPELGPICAVRDEPPQLHDQTIDLVELRLLASYGLTDALTLNVQLPLRLVRAGIVYRHLDGTAFTPDYEDIHHRNETLTGPSDPWLTLHAGARSGRFSVGGEAGITVPLGRVSDNPEELGERGLPHEHIELGAGIVTPVLGLDAQATLGARATLGGYAQAQLTPLQDRHGYQAGNRVMAGLKLDLTAVDGLQLAPMFDVLWQDAERWGGHVHEDGGSVSRIDLLAGAGATWAVSRWRFDLSARVPFFQDFLNEAEAGPGEVPSTLTYPVLLQAGVRYVWDLAGP